MRVCLVLVGGDEEGPLRGTGELLRHNARVIVEAGGEVITAIPFTKTLLGALGEYSSDIVRMASAADRRQLGRNVKPILEIVRKRRPDVIHFHVPNYRWGLDELIAANVAPRTCRVVRTEHNPLMGGPTLPVKALVRAADAAVDQFVYVSTGNRRRWEHFLPWRAGRGTVLANMVDPNRFPEAAVVHLPQLRAIPDSARRAVFVAAEWDLTDNDGRRPLAPVLRAMARVETDWHLVVVGDGDVAGARAIVDEIGLGARVHFVGSVPNAWPLVRDSDLLVNASHFEGMSVSLLEAWMLGVPVLSTEVDGIEDLVGVENLSAITAPIADVATLAQRWSQVGDSTSPFARVSDIAVRTVRLNFTPERWAADLLRLYRPNSGSR
jgi:glycosyltransferase involved in cell wall biosynthesis